jgi:hypothetical protein
MAIAKRHNAARDRNVYARVEVFNESGGRSVTEGIDGAVRQYEVTARGRRRDEYTYSLKPKEFERVAIKMINWPNSKSFARGATPKGRAEFASRVRALWAAYLFASIAAQEGKR